jgi:choline monooxygenase
VLEVDPDIRKARTLPSEFYTDPAFFELSKERIFVKTWQFAGRTDEPGNLRPFTLLAGLLNEPLLIARSASGIRCMSNVCTHRGKILVENACDGNLIRCGYHGRRFSLEGKFLSMPEFDGVENFPSEPDDLASVNVAEADGFLFVSLDPVDEFRDFVDPSFAAPLHSGELRFGSTRTYEVNAHWALYCENYLEGFHIPYVHKSLNEVVDYGTYTTETFRYASVQTGYVASGNVAGRYLFVFPNTMFNFYPWGISVNVVRPLGVDRTAVDFITYISDESLIAEGAGADLHRVEMEDESVVESVQRGIRSRFYSHGRYSPTREQGTHHFHRLIAEFFNR